MATIGLHDCELCGKNTSHYRQSIMSIVTLIVILRMLFKGVSLHHN
nr:MAG TPA: hypothetical protein [Caudoviricetes sp.]